MVAADGSCASEVDEEIPEALSCNGEVRAPSASCVVCCVCASRMSSGMCCARFVRIRRVANARDDLCGVNAVGVHGQLGISVRR